MLFIFFANGQKVVASGIVTITYISEGVNGVKDDIESNKESIDAINDDLYRTGWNAEYANFFINSKNKYRRGVNDWMWIKEVKQGDEINITRKAVQGASEAKYCKVALVKTYPVKGDSADYMTGESLRSILVSGLTLESPEDGYILVQERTNGNPDSSEPATWTINGVTVWKYSVNKRLDELEDSPINADDELSMTSNAAVKNKVLTPLITNNKIVSDHGFFELESDWWIKEQYLKDKYSSSENTVVSQFVSKIQSRQGNGKLQIAVISDTHGSGAYSWKNIRSTGFDTCYRSIAVFNQIMGECNIAFHGGDLSCDYGNSRLRNLQYMYEIVRKFKFGNDKPFFITKGNHDENNDAYVEADMLHIDWVNNTYYKRSLSTFTQVVNEAYWDGSPLYINKAELVSDTEFRNMCQHWLSPSGAIWGNGAYYYYDLDDYKLRVIVGNSFPVNDSYIVNENDEYLWLMQYAFDLSSKNTQTDSATNWKVIMLRHTQATGLSTLSDCINALANGGEFTYNGVTVDYGDINGGGVAFIAHIHGHEHMNCFSNGRGYFDIGVNKSFADPGDVENYGISVFTIDFANNKFVEDTIDGNSWEYNLNNGRIGIGVGDKFTVARSGLTIDSATSSDINIATCAYNSTDKRWEVTGVSAGECNIVVADANSNSFTYIIKVVN